MFKNEKGLTLIELLITIAVIAVVAAISVPVVANVIAASNTNALSAMQEQVDQFVAEAAESGSVSLNGSTLEARIDQNGDGIDEYLVKTFPVDSKYTVSGTGDGPYTVALGAGNGGAQPAGTTYTYAAGDWTSYYNFSAYASDSNGSLMISPSEPIFNTLTTLPIGTQIKLETVLEPSGNFPDGYTGSCTVTVTGAAYSAAGPWVVPADTSSCLPQVLDPNGIGTRLTSITIY